MMMVKKLILASASPRRAALLRSLGLAFEIAPSGASEVLDAPLPPAEHVAEIARRKTLAISQKHTDAIVLGADTVVALGNHILEKPQDAAHARDMLEHLSGKTHCVYTGLVLADTATDRLLCDVAVTQVTMRALTRHEICAYVATGEPMDKAGAYAVQGRAAVFVASVSGCFFNVVGLPLTRFWQLYQQLTGSPPDAEIVGANTDIDLLLGMKTK